LRLYPQEAQFPSYSVLVIDQHVNATETQTKTAADTAGTKSSLTVSHCGFPSLIRNASHGSESTYNYQRKLQKITFTESVFRELDYLSSQ